MHASFASDNGLLGKNVVCDKSSLAVNLILAC